MWIERLEIDGFVKLRGPFEFSEGLTLVTGPNEAGKSTLHWALMTSMFGFSGSERRRSGGTSVLSECAPWTGPPFGLKAVFRTERGAVRATWDFSSDESSQTLMLIDDHTGEDMTAEVAEKRGGYALGMYLMKLDYDEFCEVAMLEQAAIGGVRRTDPLVQALRKAVEMGASEHGVDEAESLLGDALGSAQIGVRRDNLAPLSGGRLKLSEERLGELATSLGQAEQAQNELRDLTRALEDDHARQTRLVEERTVTQQQLLFSRAAELGERTERAEQALAQAQYEPDQTVRLDPAEVDEITGLFAQYDRVHKQATQNEASAEAARELVERIQRDVAETSQQLRAVEAYRVLDASQGQTVGGLLSRIEEIDREPEEIPLAESSGSLRPAWIVVLVMAMASVAGAILVSPAALLGLLGAVAVIWIARRQAAAPAQLASSPQRRSELKQELTAALDAADAPPAEDVQIRAASYLDACKKRAAFDSLAATRGDLQRRATEAGKPVAEQQRLGGELESLETTLRERLAPLEIDVADVSAAKRDFEARVDAARKDQQDQARAEGSATALEAALGGMSMDQLRNERDTARKSLREHVAQHGEVAHEPEDQDALQRSLDELDRRVATAAGEIGGLEARIAAKEEELAPVPGMREEREELADLVERISVAAEAIHIAQGALTAAASEAHRRFAPLLNEAIAKDLPTITGGRYDTARINEELEMTLVTPETGNPVDVAILSRGTQDQIFLIQRLAILRMLVADNVNPPLLLDDVFVHFDDKRTRFGLEILARESESRQVVLFSVDPDISAALNQLGLDHHAIELEGPA